MNKVPRLLHPALAMNVIIASGTFLVAKSALHEFPPLVLGLFRFVLASAALWPVRRLAFKSVRIAPEDRKRIWLLGFLAVPLNQALFLYAMQWASASHAALLYALTPILIVLLGIFRNVLPTKGQVLGVILAFSGVLMLLIQRGLHFDGRSLIGDLLVLCAVVAWALYLYSARDIARKYGALVVTAEALLVGTVMFIPIGLAGLYHFHISSVTAVGWTGVFYLAWLTSGVNYVIWFWGVKHIRPAATAVWSNLQPPTTAALAWFLLGEPLPAGFILSGTVVLVGVWLAQAKRSVANHGTSDIK